MLGTFSFDPYFKSYRCFTVGSLEFLEIALRSFLPPPACLLALFLPAAAVQVAGAVESLPGHVLRHAGAHASHCSFSTALGCALEPPLQCHAAQSRRMVATSPSPWHGQGRGHRPPLARARALQIPQKPNPLALLLSPRPHAQNSAAAPPRTPESSPPPRIRHSRAAPPLQPPPTALPRPSAAPRPLLLAQTPREPPRRRAPSPASRRSPSTPHLRPP